MSAEDEEIVEKQYEELTVDFSKQTLKRIERANNEQQSAAVLILDNNEIQRLDNLETYTNLKKLSLVNNQLVRMYGVSHLKYLETLDLSSNSLVTIEGLKDLTELKHLNLSKNRIKTIEHLNSNLKLEKVDLSENNIMYISDISFLQNLKELNLHGNRISLLKQCEKNLPSNLEVLTLNNNSLTDLNEISHLVHLISLKELTIVNNPCLDFSEDQKFNYRPFVKNWCSSLIVLDNQPLDDIECLKAEWLYSQGRGRSFRVGEHAALIEYLITVCPKEDGVEAETEDVKKLKLILSKAQLHQQQLRAQLSGGQYVAGEGCRPAFQKKKIPGLSDRMVTSFQDSPSKDYRHSPDLMTQSLDSGLVRNASKSCRSELNHTPLQTSTTFIPIPDTLISPEVVQPNYPGPPSYSSRTSRSSSRNSPRSTPEGKVRSTNVSRKQNERCIPVPSRKQDKLHTCKSSFQLSKSPYLKPTSSPVRKGLKFDGSDTRDSDRNYRETSEEEDSEILAMKVKAIQHRVNQRRQIKIQQIGLKKENAEGKENSEPKKKILDEELKNSKEWKAAISIQRHWRGYRARNLNGEVLTGYKNIQMNRMQDYITKVVSDMEATRLALEGNRKLVVLQMQAINALWKKMTALQPSVGSTSGEDSKVSLQNLVETCSALNKQVENLQAMVKAMQNSASSIPTATQTEIIAVHTPQGEAGHVFPYTPASKSTHAMIENHPIIESTEEEVMTAKESPDDSDNPSTENTVKTETELISIFKAKDFSKDKVGSGTVSPGDEEIVIYSESLVKPSVSLNESNCEESFSSKETEKTKDDAEVQNPSNS